MLLISKYKMAKTELTKRIEECTKNLKDELELTGKHISTMYQGFKKYPALTLLLLGPMYDFGITLTIHESSNKNRKERLHEIYDD